jgi:dolichol-phosphate mannosyltransferase
MTTPNRISVILPCYNEKDNIIPLVEAIHKELADYDHQIVVVDDNSPDGTFQLVVDQKYSFVYPLRRDSEPSFAKSIRDGLEASDGNIFVVMDSDFNHQPKYLPMMIHNLEYYDCVTASRFLYGGGMNGKLRQTFSWIFNIFVRIMTRKDITDSLYGFFAIKKEIIETLDYDKIFWGYGDYCIRLMYYLQKTNISILQFPAVNGKRLSGDGNSNFLKVLIQYSVATIKLVIKG